jgi:iron complex outermembrane receptor protein/vitamin B12 transporter
MIKVDVRLEIGPLRQQIVVSDTGTTLPDTQVGASVSVTDRTQLDALNKLDVSDTLRLTPGVQVVQTGQRGGTTSIFVRGGNADFNKVLIDGIPANDIGGTFEFANLSTSGVGQVETLRGPNSVLYGSDALASVVNVTTRRGTSPFPEFTFSADGGNFQTHRQQASVSGAFHQFDYFSDFARFDTQNGIPNSSFHNGTYSGNFGWEPNRRTSIRFTLRHTAVGLGDPNALDLFGIPDDSFQREQDTYLGVTAQNQTTSHWHNLFSFTRTRLRFNFDNPSPTGIAFDPFGFGANFLGLPVTICGANGFCGTGQAILDFGGSYPQLFDSRTTIRSVYAQSDYAFSPELGASFGFRYDKEEGFTEFSGSKSPTDRDNFHYFLEAHGSLRHRVFATAGVGFEDNDVFGFAATPRVSVAYYLRRPASDVFFSSTKLRFNFGKGIEEPSIFNEGSSLFNVLRTLPQGQDLIRKFAVSPIAAERSRSFDFGVEQGLWNERARLGLTFFHERFFDLIDFVDKGTLPQLGVPPEVASALPFGAAINSDSFRSRGAEIEFKASLGHNLTFRGQYTYLSAVVTKSFASSALFPAVNPAFPGIPIGAFSPLVGNRPFRRAPHSGSLLIEYSRRRYGVNLTGYVVSKSDDSTFLSDGFFGNTLLLPNRNLLAGYQLIDLSGWFDVRHGVTLYTSMGNILSKHYQAAFGFPALPFTFRTGIKITLGGEGWRRKWRTFLL